MASLAPRATSSPLPDGTIGVGTDAIISDCDVSSVTAPDSPQVHSKRHVVCIRFPFAISGRQLGGARSGLGTSRSAIWRCLAVLQVRRQLLYLAHRESVRIVQRQLAHSCKPALDQQRRGCAAAGQAKRKEECSDHVYSRSRTSLARASCVPSSKAKASERHTKFSVPASVSTSPTRATCSAVPAVGASMLQ